MQLSFHPDGLRPHMVDWHDTARVLLRRLERDVATFPNDIQLRRLLDQIRSYPDVDQLETAWSEPAAEDLLVTATYRLGDETVSMMTTIAIVGDAHDLTLAELRIETFWPVDERSGRVWERFFGT